MRGPRNGGLRTWSGAKVSSHKRSPPGAVGLSSGAGEKEGLGIRKGVLAENKAAKMKCWNCEEDARAVCQFCGRFVCKEHAKTKPFYSGYGQKCKDNLWPSGSLTGFGVEDAVWCGQCHVEYQKTF